MRYLWTDWPCKFKACPIYSSDGLLPAPPFILAVTNQWPTIVYRTIKFRKCLLISYRSDFNPGPMGTFGMPLLSDMLSLVDKALCWWVDDLNQVCKEDVQNMGLQDHRMQKNNDCVKFTKYLLREILNILLWIFLSDIISKYVCNLNSLIRELFSTPI